MTTTPSTASQAPAVSIADNEQFIDLMHALSSVPSSVYAGSEFSKVINYIDAKLAQAREEGFEEMRKVIAENAVLMADACRRATAAEAKLEAIRQGVGALPGYWLSADGNPSEVFHTRTGVVALLQPEPKAGGLSYQDCGTGTQSVRQLAASMIQLNEPECELAFMVNSRRINIYVKILRVLEQESDESGLPG